MLQLMKRPPAARRLSVQSVMRGFVRKNDGATAVEFSLVAAPFFLLMFAIIETALIFFAGQVMETAVADSSRLIMTGQAQQQGFSEAQFKSAVCDRASGLFDCGGIYVDVKKYPSFASISLAPPLDANGVFQNNTQYQPGGENEIVVVRMFYEWPVYVSLPLSNMAGAKRLMTATAAFRNEPFGPSVAPAP